jgi:hypothetical protein
VLSDSADSDTNFLIRVAISFNIPTTWSTSNADDFKPNEKDLLLNKSKVTIGKAKTVDKLLIAGMS